MRDAGITSNTGVLHVTLLEGAVTNIVAIAKSAADVFSHDTRCFMKDIQTVPTINLSRQLVLMQVSLPTWEVWKVWNDTPVRLPQWHLHIALGTVPDEQSEAACQCLRQTLLSSQEPRVLYTSPERLSWLAPTGSSGWT